MNNNLDGAPLTEDLTKLEDNRHLLALKKAYHQIEVPMDAVERLKDTIHEANAKKRRRSWFQGSVTILAAACLCIVFLLNSSATIAQAMSRIPGLGGLFEAVTFRHYENSTDDYYAKVDIPKIVYYGMDESESITAVNQEIKGYVERLIAKFESDIKVDGSIHQSMEVTYHVILNNDHWFSLRIDVVEAIASSYEHTLFYHIDKSTGEMIQLKDMFLESSDYTSVISEEIKRQMKENIKNGTDVYLLGDDDNNVDDFMIDKNQSFYINDSQDIVIHFDDYEIAPGSEGSKDFVISKDVVKDILK
ncbi:DUF3298 and DUF4163 domain-containing protein [Lachnoclostridium phytofermentans]|uniref:DUF3298 domain-containing protein n=1 Tax=Lachnoclostridium phytofermentans (strain ATCC 700394 / DSM 18823 / ISDg) TaxID=357809 RepID=A9KQP1_LACP7|nr:DUF3298 and DUF4163 domain-containing protein [Lachnoclostridium phytofermentans]ABX41954.1 conserved hypothetical protein [Lachnoclostridium phytofermentans ISDg]